MDNGVYFVGFLPPVKYNLQEIGLKICEANNFWMRGFFKKFAIS